MDDNSIKQIMGALREKQGLSQLEMADRIGVDRNTYRNIEKGTTKIICPHLESIAEALGTSTEHLLLGYDPNDISLEEASRAQSKLHEMEALYNSNIEKLEREIKALHEMIEILKEQLRDKDMIISMLRKNS